MGQTSAGGSLECRFARRRPSTVFIAKTPKDAAWSVVAEWRARRYAWAVEGFAEYLR
jgi:hypothetical protein